MAKRHTKLHSVVISNRNESSVFSIAVGGSADKIIGIRVSTTITGTPMKVFRHYVGNSTAVIPSLISPAIVQSLPIQDVMRNKVVAYTVVSIPGESLFYARPTEVEGTPNFKLNGIDEPFNAPVTISLVDLDTGDTMNYDVYQSSATNLNGQLYIY